MQEEVVIFSDAGVRRQREEGVDVGLGWVMLRRSTGEVVAAVSWVVAVTGEDGGSDDVNRWETRAALAGLGGLVFLRSGRVGAVWPGDCRAQDVLSSSELAQLQSLIAF